MEISHIEELVDKDFAKLKNDIVSTKPRSTYLTSEKEYNPATHNVVTDKISRPDKIINVGSEEDPQNETVFVARLSVPLQKRIVRMRANFLCGNPVELSSKTNDETQIALLEVIKKTWFDNKLDYKNKQILRILMSEMEVAVLWYSVKTDSDYWADTPNSGITSPVRFKMRILSNSNGDKLYPVFDDFNDMISFAREYVTIDAEQKKVYHFDIYTADYIYYATQKEGTYSLDKTDSNTFGKIPIVYCSQNAPEWADVQTLIDQYEEALSDHTDSNKYNLDPTTVVKGHVTGWSKKGEKGRVLEIDPDAAVDLLEWDQAIASRELEQKNLLKHIMDETSTPILSPEDMKQMGDYSYIALKMFFLDAHMAAAEKEEIYGEFIQRMINLLKSAHAAINKGMKKALVLNITPKFEYYLPKNDKEKVDLLMSANGGKPILSRESSVMDSPLSDDSDEELKKLQAQDAEQERKDNAAMGLNNQFN